jgi:hypothetical protein
MSTLLVLQALNDAGRGDREMAAGQMRSIAARELRKAEAARGGLRLGFAALFEKGSGRQIILRVICAAMFGGDWESAEATILASRVKTTTGDGLVSIHEFVAEVRPASAPPFRTTLDEPRIATDFWPPDVGAVVGVKVNVKRQKAKFDKADPTISRKARKAGADAAFRATLNGP